MLCLMHIIKSIAHSSHQQKNQIIKDLNVNKIVFINPGENVHENKVTIKMQVI